MEQRKEKGITLIALVITIIVLLILAGITINLTIGQDGILRRAQEAGKNYTNAASYENEQLEELTNVTDRIIQNLTGGTTKEPKETKIEINISGENEQSTAPISLSVEVTEDGEKLTNYKWVLNNESKEIGIQEDLYTEEIINQENATLEMNEVGTYYLHVLTTNAYGTKKETIKGPIEIVAQYHTHVGTTTTSGGCYTTPVYHSHKDASGTVRAETYQTSSSSGCFKKYNTYSKVCGAIVNYQNGSWYYDAGAGFDVIFCSNGHAHGGNNCPNNMNGHACNKTITTTYYTVGCGKTTSTVQSYSLNCNKTEGTTIDLYTISY